MCEPQVLCTQKVGPVCPSDHREAGPGEGYATTWPAREGVLAGLSSQSSNLPNLCLRQGSSQPTSALLWGGHLGSGGTVTPRWTRHHSDSPRLHRSPGPGSQQPWEEGRPESQAARCPGVEVGRGLLMASRFPSSKASLLGPSSFRDQVRAPAGPPLDLPFPTPTTYTCTQECTHTGPPAGPHTVIHINTVTHLDTNTEMPAATRVPTRAHRHPIGTHTHTHTQTSQPYELRTDIKRSPHT